MKVTVNGNDYVITIIGHKVTVNGKQIAAEFNENEITIDGKKFYLDFIEDTDPFLMIVSGMTYVVSKSSYLAGSMKEIRAPISGRLVELLVKPGDYVKKDQTMFILEAMKMQNHINSPTNAKISDLKIGKGDLVKTGQILATLI